jgi:hypothetical protein
MKVYQSAVAFYIGLASITSTYLSDVVEASPKDEKKTKKSTKNNDTTPSSRVTKQKFRALLPPYSIGGTAGDLMLAEALNLTGTTPTGKLLISKFFW